MMMMMISNYLISFNTCNYFVSFFVDNAQTTDNTILTILTFTILLTKFSLLIVLFFQLINI